MVTAGTKTNTKKLTIDSFFNKEVNTYEYPFKQNNLYKIVLEYINDYLYIVTIKVKENDEWYLYRASEKARNKDEAIRIANKFYINI